MTLEEYFKLKTGDKVICIRNYYNRFSKNKIYTVKYQRNDFIYVTEDDLGSKTNGRTYKFFEKLDSLTLEDCM